MAMAGGERSRPVHERSCDGEALPCVPALARCAAVTVAAEACEVLCAAVTVLAVLGGPARGRRASVCGDGVLQRSARAAPGSPPTGRRAASPALGDGRRGHAINTSEQHGPDRRARTDESDQHHALANSPRRATI